MLEQIDSLFRNLGIILMVTGLVVLIHSSLTIVRDSVKKDK